MKKRKNVLWKDFRMEIKKTFNRFISIFLIVALGVAFFSGIRASEPDLLYTADEYYDERNLMDIRVQGTLGLTDEDVEAIQEIEGVAYAAGGYSVDALCWSGDNQTSFVVMADMGELNQVDVIEGRMPQEAGEVLIDAGNFESMDYEIGDTITFESGDDTDILDTLTTDTYTIVGIGSSPEYITFSRGSTTIGDGELDSFAVVTEDSFQLEVYTKIDVWVEGASDEVVHTDGYDELVSEVLDRIEETLADVRCETRYTEVYEEAMAEIEDAQQELEDAQEEADEELSKAYEELLEAEEELSDGEQELSDSEEELADAKELIEENEAEISDGWAQIASSEEELEDGWTQYEEGLSEYEEQLASVDFEAAREQIAQGWAEIEEAKEELAAQEEAAYAQAEEEATEQALAAVEEATADTAAQLDEAEDALEELAENLETYSSQLSELKSQLENVETQIAELESALAVIETQAAQDSSAASAEETDTADESTEDTQVEDAQDIEETDETNEMNALVASYEEELAVLLASQETLEENIAALESVVDALQQQYDESYESGMEAIAAGREEMETAKESAVEEAIAAADAQVESQLTSNEEYVAALAAIEENEQLLTEQEAELDEGEAALEEAKAELESSYQQLVDAQEEIEAAKEELSAGEEELAQAQEEVSEAEEEIEEARTQLEDGKEELEEGWEDYEEGEAEADEEIADAQEEIDDALEEVEVITYPEWYVTDRTGLEGYTELGENADRLKALGQVFPVIFFLVAALISLTTMTRMVEEERVQIGTLKALGYRKSTIARKYLLYALLATVGGSIVGVLIGEKILPYVIINAYKMMYPYIPNTTVPYNAYYAILASAVAIVCVVAATLLACYKELAAVPAELMRPASPKQGHRIWLEHIKPLWRHISFTQKNTLRNLFRYKKRLFMTIFGIGGCMGLMVAGFGIKDSIGDVANLQYDLIQTYTGMVVLNDEADEEDTEQLYETMDSMEGLDSYMTAYMMNYDIASDTEEMEAYVVVPQDMENLSDYFYFNDRKSGEEYTLDDSGAIISEKTANTLGVEVGDTITIVEDTFSSQEVVIAAICENYVGHYVYLTENLYEETFGESPEYNTVLIKVAEGVDETEIGQAILEEESALSVAYMDTVKQSLDEVLGALDIIVVVLIVAAGMLAFVVLYNLNNISINERRRELATIKVLGFYDGELAAYVYRENVYLTIIGVLIGCVIGKYLHQFIITTVEIDSCMFGRTVYPTSYLYSMLLTVVFAVIVNFAMFFKLRKIDMVESLKSVE